jgi:hypothetical protein
LTPVTVEYLRARYPAGPQTYHWPGQITYRFGEPSARIVIWDDQQRQADWWLMANSQEALATLARQVWHLGGLSGTLEGESDAAEAVLSALLSE